MTLTPEQKDAGWIEWKGGECPIKDKFTLAGLLWSDGSAEANRHCDDQALFDADHGGERIIAYRIIEAHGADAAPARPTPFPADYSELVFDDAGWSQTIIVDGKRPEWLRDDDLCASWKSQLAGWRAGCWGKDELAIRVRRREPKRETVQCIISHRASAPLFGFMATIDLLDGEPDLSTLKIAEDAL